MIFSPLWSTAQSHLDGRTLWCKTPNDCGEIEDVFLGLGCLVQRPIVALPRAGSRVASDFLN
jgi:hypothetical protein